MAWKKFLSRTGETMMVPESRVDDMERIGYGVVEEKQDVEHKSAEAANDEAAAHEDFDYTLKPISEWTREECAQYIKENNIDLGGAKKAEKIREIIQRHIESTK